MVMQRLETALLGCTLVLRGGETLIRARMCYTRGLLLMAVAVSLVYILPTRASLKNIYYVQFSLSYVLVVVCGKDRKEGANV